MTLRKRYLRNLKKHLSFYVCTILLTAMVVVLYLCFAAASVVVMQELKNFYRDYKAEDAQFRTATELSEEDVKSLEEKFGILLERQSYVDLEEEQYTVRVLSPAEKTDLYQISGERDLEKDGEILLNTGFMRGNQIREGDEIRLGDRGFSVAGDFERPDYLFTIRETTDTFAMTKEFGLAEVSEADYDALEKSYGASGEYYAILYQGADEAEVRKYINEKYKMLSYLGADANSRLSTPEVTVEEASKYMDSIVVLLVIFIALIIAVVLGRRIQNDRRQIGVLIALGYRKRELARHYAFYGLLPGLLGGLLGLGFSILFSQRLISVLFYKFEPLPVAYKVKPSDGVLAVLVPAILYTLTVYLSAKKVMRTDVITMISGRKSIKEAFSMRMKRSRLSVRSKFRLRQIFGKPGRSLIVIIGLAFGGMLYAFCACCVDSMDTYVKSVVDQIGEFEYEYFLKLPRTGEPEEGSPMLGMVYEVKDSDDVIMLLGTDDGRYISFSDEEGNPVPYDPEKCYLTSMASVAFGVKAGESIIFFDPISLEEHSVTIEAVLENDAQSAIYCSREKAGEIMGVPGECYNVILSETALSFEKDELLRTVSKKDLADQINEVKVNMENMMGMLNIFSILICVIVVYVMVNVLVSESASSVSMLKVLGYRNREINGMVLNVYHFLIPVAILLSLVLGVEGTRMVFTKNVATYKTYLEALIYPASVLKLVLLVVVSYGLSLMLLRGKIRKVSMVESLKDNRE